MKKKKLIIIIIAAVLVLAVAAGVVLFLILGRDSGDEPGEDQLQASEPTEPPPEPIDVPFQYQVEEQSIAALPAGDRITVFCEQDEETGISTYCYQGLPSTVQRVADYCQLLTAEDFGFVPVDGEMYETSLPEFFPASVEEPTEAATQQTESSSEDAVGTDAHEESTAPTQLQTEAATDPATDPESAQEPEALQEGSVHLVLPVERVVESETEGETEVMEGRWLLSLQVSWDEEQCLVTPAILSGQILVPVEPVEPTGPAPVPMTLTEALDHVKSLPPAQLGLEGETMEEYRIYALDGLAMVGDTPCLRLNIYDDTAHDTNAVVGQYLLSGDGLHMYQLTEEGTVRLLY